MSDYTDIQAAMRLLWLRAYNEGGLSLEFPTMAQALRIRTLLYSLRKSARVAHRDDAELTIATENCVLRTEFREAEGRFRLHLEHIGRDPALNVVAAAIGAPIEGAAARLGATSSPPSGSPGEGQVHDAVPDVPLPPTAAPLRRYF